MAPVHGERGALQRRRIEPLLVPPSLGLEKTNDTNLFNSVREQLSRLGP